LIGFTELVTGSKRYAYEMVEAAIRELSIMALRLSL
jgi:hypothetical protein